MKNLIFLICLLSLAACSKKSTQTDMKINNAGASEIEQVYHQLTGQYESINDESLDSVYQDLVFHIVPIKFAEKGEWWLYAEQHAVSKPKEKRVQQLYKLKQLTDMIGLEKYNLGKLGKELSHDDLDGLKNTDLKSFRKQRGCTVYLRPGENDHYIGTTLLKNCTNRFKGSMYARHEIQSFEDKLIYLEQGFDEYDRFIWGTKKKGVVFIKK